MPTFIIFDVLVTASLCRHTWPSHFSACNIETLGGTGDEANNYNLYVVLSHPPPSTRPHSNSGQCQSYHGEGGAKNEDAGVEGCLCFNNGDEEDGGGIHIWKGG